MQLNTNNIMLVLLLFSSFVINAQNEKDIQAKLVIEQNDNIVSIYATAINTTDLHKSEYTYSTLSLKRSEKGNLSKNSQSGVFSIQPNETKVLSQQKLGIDTNSYIDIFFFIKKGDKLISKDTIRIGEIKKTLGLTPIKETEMEISGIVIENVLTKSGKDFYEFFGIINRINGVKFPFVIIINEKPSFGGRNSEISVMANDLLIYKFRALPKEEFLQAAAKETHKRVLNYYTKRKELFTGEIQY